MAGDSDSREIDSTPRKTETWVDPPLGFFFAGERLLPIGRLKDPEYERQCDIFYDQFEKSEGFDVDWDSLGYQFAATNFEWEPHCDPHQSKEELLRLLTQTAIDEFNEEHIRELSCSSSLLLSLLSSQLSLIYMIPGNRANTRPCAGMMYFITFRAKDVSSQDPKLYQAQVQKFCDEISVLLMRLRPTQD
ncbi:unnamed protein product, partial [Thlaspi arvense]